MYSKDIKESGLRFKNCDVHSLWAFRCKRPFPKRPKSQNPCLHQRNSQKRQPFVDFVMILANKTENSTQPDSKGQVPASVLTLVPATSNSQFDWLFDNKRLTNYSKELLLGFGEKLVNFGSLSRENRAKD